jgi:hypothetical protein
MEDKWDQCSHLSLLCSKGSISCKKSDMQDQNLRNWNLGFRVVDATAESENQQDQWCGCGDVRSKKAIVRERTEKERGGWDVREKESTREGAEKQRRKWDGEREWEKVLFGFWRERDTRGLHALQHMLVVWKGRGTCDSHGLGHVLRERGAMAFIHWNTSADDIIDDVHY